MEKDNLNNSHINWFPGHMAKAIREMKEKMRLVDLVIELRDARIPFSSANPVVDEIVGNKPRLILLNKANIADKNVTNEWIEYFRNKNILCLDIDSLTGYNVKKITKYASLALKDEFLRREKKQIKSRLVKAIIIGIPNVGKSTLINTLAKRKATNVGDKPGVTKNQTWINVSEDLILLDTPGILWPKFEDQRVAIKLAFATSIKDEVLNEEQIATLAIDFLTKAYPNNIINKYNINIDEPNVIDQIALRRGCLIKGGAIDYSRVYKLIVNDLRNNRMGDISYERPSELI
jgi:ribosome biogenesis GTPase A